MKTRKMNIAIFVSLISIFFVTGCREITTTTTIFPNGSCERIVSVKGDSSEVADRSFPVPRDTSWSINQQKEDNIIYTAKKFFKKVSDLNKEFTCDGDSIKKVRICVKLKKRFRWFYTFLTYRETYKNYNQFHFFPISDYLSKNEMELYYINEDTLDLDDKVDTWYEKSLYEEFHQKLLECAKKLDDPQLPPELIDSKKNSLYKATLEIDEVEKNVDELLHVCEKILQTKAIWKLKKNISQIIQLINEKNEFFILTHSGKYTNNVIMPGLIIRTNAETVEGNKVTWNIKGSRFLWQDYEMQVESRIVNKWMIGITTAVLVLLGVLLILSFIRKRKVS